MVFEDVWYRTDIGGQHLVGMGGSRMDPLGLERAYLLFYYILDSSFIGYSVIFLLGILDFFVFNH